MLLQKKKLAKILMFFAEAQLKRGDFLIKSPLFILIMLYLI